MMYLLATTDIIRTTTSSAATVDVVLYYQEAVKATGATAAYDRVTHAFSGATSDDTLTGPGGSNFRTLKQGTWCNKDAVLACDVTVMNRIAGPVDFQLIKVTLQPGDMLIYIEGIGFFVNRVASTLDKVIVMSADSVHATAATFADVAGMTCPLLSGKIYIVTAKLFTINNASTTGSQFGYNIGAAPTNAQFGEVGAVTNSVTAGVVGIGTATARDTAIVAQTTGQTALGMHEIAGFIQPSADGTFAIRGTSEVTVAAGMTVKAGSSLEIRQAR